MSIYGHELNVYNFDSDEINSINEAVINESEETKNILVTLGKQLLKLGFKGVGKILKVIGLLIALNASIIGILLLTVNKNEKDKKKVFNKINSDSNLKKNLQDAVALCQNYILDNAKEKKYISKKEYKFDENNIYDINKKAICINFNILEIDIAQLFKDIAKEEWEDVAYKIAKEKYKKHYIEYERKDEEEFYDNINDFFEDYCPDDYGKIPFTGKYKEVKEKINEYIETVSNCINGIPLDTIKNISMSCYMNYVNQDTLDEDSIENHEIHYFDDFYYNQDTVSIYLSIKFSNN